MGDCTKSGAIAFSHHGNDVTPNGDGPVLNGEPETGISAPVAALMAYPEPVLSPVLVAYKNF